MGKAGQWRIGTVFRAFFLRKLRPVFEGFLPEIVRLSLRSQPNDNKPVGDKPAGLFFVTESEMPATYSVRVIFLQVSRRSRWSRRERSVFPVVAELALGPGAVLCQQE
jgi:hypothetical protein